MTGFPVKESTHEIKAQPRHGARRSGLYEMTGFRVPHFGYFQSREQILFLFGVLQRLGYRYDSSLTAYNFLRHRGHLSGFSLQEFPLSPHPRHPRGVLDSWGYMSVGGRASLDGFVADFQELIRWTLDAGVRHHFNLYVDPYHVFEWPGFETCLALVKSHEDRIQSSTYSAIVG